MKRMIISLVALMLVLVSTRLVAQVPRVINYQGTLLGSDEQPVAEGEYQITFRIYDFEGTELWSEVHPKVSVSAGMFGVLLGTVSPLGIDFNTQCFLGIQVGNDPELEPRMQLTSAVYSLNSDRVQGYGVSESPTPNTLLPLDANGQIPASAIPGSSGAGGNYLRKNSPDTSRGTNPSPMLLVSNEGELSGDGINGRSIAGRGVEGRSENHNGIVGWTDASDKSGVFGHSGNGSGVTGHSETNAGVAGWTGASNRSGVFGSSTDGRGMTGRSDKNDGAVGWTGAGDKSGVFGHSTSGSGVTGRSDTNDGTVGWTGASDKSGVRGFSTDGRGVVGRSDKNNGLVGWTGASDKGGVYGHSVNGFGMEAHSDNNNAIRAHSSSTNQWVPTIYGQNVGTGDGIYGWSQNRHGIFGVTYSSDPNHAGIYAVNNGAGYAARFDGTAMTKVLEITGGSDLSEQFEIHPYESGLAPSPGMVVSIDPEGEGGLVVSREACDRRVAGIISGAGGVQPGMLMGQKGSKADGSTPVALTGRVYCWADASDGAIQPGDLLTTSDTPGHAMKVTDYTKARGAILGKAMSSLEQGRGLLLVLVTLQ
jgi:hypothetical protein